jgi:hypothetical protein
MEEYAMLVRNHWEQNRPEQLALLPDPDLYFQQVGKEMADEIETMADELAGQTPPGETYWQRVGRLNEATNRAREIVLRERLVSDEE